MSEMHDAEPVSQPFPHFERFLDSREAAALLQIHPKTLQRLARKGEIRAMRIGKLWRFRASDLDAWVHLRLKLAGYESRRGAQTQRELQNLRSSEADFLSRFRRPLQVFEMPHEDSVLIVAKEKVRSVTTGECASIALT